MSDNTIGLIAAMPDEIRPLLRRVAPHSKGELAGFRRFDFSVAGRGVALVQSGMGPQRAQAAAEALIAAVAPRLIVNFGFAGAVRSETAVGDLVLARQVLFLEGERLSPLPQPDAALRQLVAGAAAGGGAPLREGTCITSGRIEDKRRVAALLRGEFTHPVLEMETAAIVAAGAKAGIPVLALRGVSDAAEEELGFSLEEFCDAELVIRPGRVLATVARKPWIIPQLIRLAGNSRRAGENLARALEAILRAL